MRRPRLEALLARLIEAHPAVLVVGDRGRRQDDGRRGGGPDARPPLAWLTLDRTDAAPGRLVDLPRGGARRALPQLAGVATDALAARIPHPEAAGLLAEAVGDEPVLLVLDDLERLEDVARTRGR